MVQPNCIDLWKCRMSRYGSLQANGKNLEQIFDGARSQVHRVGVVASQNCKCFFAITGGRRKCLYIISLGTRQGVLDAGAMKFLIWDLGQAVCTTLDYQEVYSKRGIE
ncbi:hypothetical protein GOP47_0026066 [Adiantum capillus-veneris]|uniref:Uncharacterized protein n=1 Tax=Adiantum capillus-veneris TaxID=13818 RepID=A0A9D4U1R8_ADICA|nr:hypothetical protein GOP47_0026066 [Adiantum capillus-veneris]